MNPPLPEVIVLATRNHGKIKELRALLHDFGLMVKGLADFPDLGEIPETGATFAENALIKAAAVSRAFCCIAVADDSGLEVDALSGAPGVYSARYAGPGADDAANNAKLLAALADTPEDKRTARFRCAAAAVGPGLAPLVVQGTWEGRILFEPQGKNGFGYDPLFFDPTAGQSAAEMDKGAKNQRSHRGKAIRALILAWPAFLAQKSDHPNPTP